MPHRAEVLPISHLLIRWWISTEIRWRGRHCQTHRVRRRRRELPVATWRRCCFAMGSWRWILLWWRRSMRRVAGRRRGRQVVSRGRRRGVSRWRRRMGWRRVVSWGRWRRVSRRRSVVMSWGWRRRRVVVRRGLRRWGLMVLMVAAAAVVVAVVLLLRRVVGRRFSRRQLTVVMLPVPSSMLLHQWRLGVGSRSLRWCLDWREGIVRQGGGGAVRRERRRKSDEEGNAHVVLDV
uniref:Uncharacterized protein n=1 Tax=Oryza brachyantha TaxID=4533 RepID=J3LXS3_ORYBR